ncbi:MAG: radical SAM protein [Candidatus Brocadiae bacterium]|nr:radical SAM protein [Candidatus Brocadiia bacterium]
MTNLFIKSLLRKIRINRIITRLLGTQFHTNINRIEIDVTWNCNLHCKNCDRSCRQAPTQEQMSIQQIQKFVFESQQNHKKWEQIRILGGEPTLHPDILAILKILENYKNFYSPETKLILISNGYGPIVHSILKKLPKSIVIKDTVKQSPDQSTFEPFNIAPIDLPGYQQTNFLNGCWITTYCGLALNRHGYYPCGVAGGIDRVFGLCLGKLQMPKEPSEMLPVLDACCRLCGHFLRGYFIPKEKRELVNQEPCSPTWKKAYQNFISHKPELPFF